MWCLRLLLTNNQTKKFLYAGYAAIFYYVGFAIFPILGSILFEYFGYAYTYLISSGIVFILGLIPEMIVP
jgi:MFS family permease